MPLTLCCLSSHFLSTSRVVPLAVSSLVLVRMTFVPFVPLSVMNSEGEFGSFRWCCLLVWTKAQDSLITTIRMHRHSICLLPTRTWGVAARNCRLSLLSRWPPHAACCLGTERRRRKLLALPASSENWSGDTAGAGKSDKGSQITIRPCTPDACWCESHKWVLGGDSKTQLCHCAWEGFVTL